MNGYTRERTDMSFSEMLLPSGSHQRADHRMASRADGLIGGCCRLPRCENADYEGVAEAENAVASG